MEEMEEKILQALEGLSHQITTLSEKVDSQGERIIVLLKKVDNQGERISVFSERVSILSERISAFSGRLDHQGIQIKENTQVLKAQEQIAQVNKVESNKIAFIANELSDEIKEIRKGLLNVELITASNWSDITRIKFIK